MHFVLPQTCCLNSSTLSFRIATFGSVPVQSSQQYAVRAVQSSSVAHAEMASVRRSTTRHAPASQNAWSHRLSVVRHAGHAFVPAPGQTFACNGDAEGVETA